MAKRYYKYYICGEYMLKSLSKEIATKRFEKLGEDISDMKSFICYKQASKHMEGKGRINYDRRSN